MSFYGLLRVQTRDKTAVDLTSIMFPSIILRYELPQPTANQKHDITSWTEAVDNSLAQLEHQAERCTRYTHMCFSEKRCCIRKVLYQYWKAVLLPQKYMYPIAVKDSHYIVLEYYYCKCYSKHFLFSSELRTWSCYPNMVVLHGNFTMKP